MTKGFIYVISSPSTDKIYVGSTTEELNIRFSKHKTNILYCYSDEIIKYGDAVIKLVEEVEFTEKEELLWIEREYYELWKNDCVNKKKPIINDEEKIEYANEYYLKNREEKINYKRLHLQKNREKINEKRREKYRRDKNVK